MGQILLLTTANLPTNPRLLKEIDLLKNDHQLTVILFKLGNWSDSKNLDLIHQRPEVRFVLLDATRKRFIYWLTWAILEKIARCLINIFPSSTYLTALYLSRRSIMLKRAMRKLNKPDLIISHTLGTLFPAYYWAEKWNIYFGYDAEDYDPGISVPEAGKKYRKKCENLLNHCLPFARYITSASPLIGQYTLNLIGSHPNHQVVLNSFPTNEFSEPEQRNDKELRFIWFSQHISFGRGLEPFFEAIRILVHEKNLPVKLVLTLVGDMDVEFKTDVIKPFLDDVLRPIDVGETMSFQSFHDSYRSIERIRIEIKQPMLQMDLHHELAKHDVGLALEFNQADLNRQLCLTNKIIAYAQAGLYILATDTPAQTQFMATDHERGIISIQSPESMKDSLLWVVENMAQIKSNSKKRYEKAKDLAYQNEALKIIRIHKSLE